MRRSIFLRGKNEQIDDPTIATKLQLCGENSSVEKEMELTKKSLTIGDNSNAIRETPTLDPPITGIKGEVYQRIKKWIGSLPHRFS